MGHQNKAGASGHPGTTPGKNLGKHFSSSQWLLFWKMPWKTNSTAIIWETLKLSLCSCDLMERQPNAKCSFSKRPYCIFYENSCSPITQPTKRAWRDIKMVSSTYKEKIGTPSSSWAQKSQARDFEPSNGWSFHGLRLKLCCILAFLEFPTHRYKRQYR